jgi:hypothetical protein
MDRGSRSVGAADHAVHPYPMAPSGGLFLVLVGLGLIAAVAFSGEKLADYESFSWGWVWASWL